MKPKILIVIANYYKHISTDLLKSTVSHVHKKSKFNAVKVPGVFEIPVVISKNIKKYDGFIALGCVIRGETPHFDFISQACSIGLMQASLETSKPVLFGVLTTENEQQAKDRASAEKQNKGRELALSALQMVELLRK